MARAEVILMVRSRNVTTKAKDLNSILIPARACSYALVVEGMFAIVLDVKIELDFGKMLPFHSAFGFKALERRCAVVGTSLNSVADDTWLSPMGLINL